MLNYQMGNNLTVDTIVLIIFIIILIEVIILILKIGIFNNLFKTIKNTNILLEKEIEKRNLNNDKKEQ